MYIVWVPILESDTEAAAIRSSAMFSGSGVVHFWDRKRTLATAIGPQIGLTSGVAWDVYLVHPRSSRWDGTPPAPAMFMHQLRGRLPDEALLDAPRLAAGVRELVTQADRS